MKALVKISVLSTVALATLIAAGSADAAKFRPRNPLLLQGIIIVSGNPADTVSLNPQPLPPKSFSHRNFGAGLELNPQPEPPGIY